EALFRPDLLLRIGRLKGIQWNQFPVSDYRSFQEYVLNNLQESFIKEVLACPSIIIRPYGSKDRLLKGLRVDADNRQFFTSTEILWKAKEIQEAANPAISNGTGIYRLGFEQGLP